MEREGAKPLEGRVARLILLVVVSVCVVFCVLCCLQNNPVFSSVCPSPYLIFWNMKIMSYVFGRFLCRSNYDRKKLRPKKRYSRLANGWNKSQIINHLLCQNRNTNYDWKKLRPKKKVQSSGQLCFLAGSFVNQITTGKNYDWKKRYSCLVDGWNKSQITVCHVKIWRPITTGKNYDRKKKVQLSGRRLE